MSIFKKGDGPKMNRRTINRLNISLVLLMGSLCTSALGQDSSRVEIKEEDLKEFAAAAGEYLIKLEGQDDALQLNAKSILNWTNPTRTTEKGAIYLWYRQGRPEVIASIFTYSYDNQIFYKHEFHSLATSKLTNSYENVAVWHPERAGVEFKPIPGAPVPGNSAVRRRLQAKLLARRFGASMEDRASGNIVLRLVSNPIATYEPTGGPCQSGAIFSMAYGTDPEVLLLIESRKPSSDQPPQWHYAFARYHYFALAGLLDGKEVWTADLELAHETKNRSTTELRDKVYISFRPR